MASKMGKGKRLGLEEILKFAKKVAIDATNLQSESDEGESGGAAPDGSFNVDWAAEKDDKSTTTSDLTLTQNYTSYRQSSRGLHLRASISPLISWVFVRATLRARCTSRGLYRA